MAKSSSDAKVYEELKQALLEKKVSILEKLNTWEDNSSPSGLKEMGDIADIASGINDDVLSSVLTEKEIDLLHQIEAALLKIEKGTYGICEGTNKKIPIARLKAIPWTPYTVEYAEIVAKNKSKSRLSSSSTQTYPTISSIDNDYMD
jgi:DnaK suppressor protein